MIISIGYRVKSPKGILFRRWANTVLTMLDKRAAGVEAVIYTGKVSKQLQLDIDKHNAQYPPVEVRTFAKAPC